MAAHVPKPWSEPWLRPALAPSQVRAVLAAGLKPILCIGESKGEYEAGRVSQRSCTSLLTLPFCPVLLSHMTSHSHTVATQLSGSYKAGSTAPQLASHTTTRTHTWLWSVMALLQP